MRKRGNAMTCSRRMLILGAALAAVVWPGVGNRPLKAFDSAPPAKAPNPLCGGACLQQLT
jgi:hypothetical protein